MFFENQIKAQQKYQDSKLPPKVILEKLIGSYLSFSHIQFIESFQFCFIATSNSQGQCDCSFRGSDPSIDFADTGELQPLLIVVNQNLIIMPDFSGNGLMDSVGNIMDNPHIGLLFINPTQAQRLRVNGNVEIMTPMPEHLVTWPNAKRILSITVDRVFFNCNKRIKASILGSIPLGDTHD